MWLIREDWNVPPENVSAYLYRAVRNKALNVRKHERVVDDFRTGEAISASEMGKAARNTGEDGLMVQELGEALRRALEKVSPRGREIFLLSRIEGLNYTQIARVLGIAPNTVYTQMGRAIKSLYESLKEWRT